MSVSPSRPITSEPTFITYTKITDVILDNVDSTGDISMQTGMFIDELNSWIYYVSNYNLNFSGSPLLGACKIDGSFHVDLINAQSEENAEVDSILNRYLIYANLSPVNQFSGLVSNGAILSILDVSLSINSSLGFLYAISKSGKYIAIIGADANNSKRRHLVVFQGS